MEGRPILPTSPPSHGGGDAGGDTSGRVGSGGWGSQRLVRHAHDPETIKSVFQKAKAAYKQNLLD
jgi:hypothetical protein